MKILHSFKRHFTLLLVAVLVSIVVSSFMVISKLLEQHYSSRQAALSPFFSLIADTISKPLYVSQMMAKDTLFIKLLESYPIDEVAVFEYLQNIETYFNVQSFVALDKNKIMYSGGQKYYAGTPAFDWFFELENNNLEMYGAIGNEETPHFYVDMRMKNPHQKFIGYAGVGINLNSFAQEFSHFHTQYQASFYFVNEADEIVLSSQQDIVKKVYSDEVHLVSSYDWYQSFDPNNIHQNENIVTQQIEIDSHEFLVSRIHIPELNWYLYILTTPNITNSKLLWEFLSQTAILLAILFSLAGLMLFSLRYYNLAVLGVAYSDNLTGLPNRTHFESVYDKLPESSSLSLVLLDIDHFKRVNDTYGHNGGDAVLKSLAENLTHMFRSRDIVARWGGEEFAVLLPSLNEQQAMEIAERCRQFVASETLQYEQSTITITASFGVAYSNHKMPLQDIMELADQALYKAKDQGRNKVVLAPSSQA